LRYRARIRIQSGNPFGQSTGCAFPAANTWQALTWFVRQAFDEGTTSA
jgi:hypothetical protein